jgi:uncharacterized protein YneF (UPF0154 family)
MLVVFGADNFMIPTLLGILIALTVRRKGIEKKLQENPSAAEEGDGGQ